MTKEELQLELDKLTDEERYEILDKYCKGCGKNRPCYCQNDD